MAELASRSRFRRWVRRKLRQRGVGARLSAHLHHSRNWAKRYVDGEFDIGFDTAAEIVAYFETTMTEALGEGESGREFDQLRMLWADLHPAMRRKLLDDASFYVSLSRLLVKKAPGGCRARSTKSRARWRTHRWASD